MPVPFHLIPQYVLRIEQLPHHLPPAKSTGLELELK